MLKTILVGKRASLAATIIAVSYGLLQILWGLQVIPYPGNLYWYFLPSFFLAPAFLMITVSLDILAPPNARVWTITAWLLATINCMMMIMIYSCEPGHLNPSHFNWHTGDIVVMLFEPHTKMISLQYAGGFLVNASTFILAFAFRNCNAKSFFRSLLINGLLLPLLILSYFCPQYYYLTFVSIVTFPLAMVHACRFFSNQKRELYEKQKEAPCVEWLIE